jgi:hypothetical protein
MTAPETTFTTLRTARYIQLTTFRKDGRAVATPVWLAPDGDTLLAFSDATSGKVKRIRNSGRVLVAPCDGRGRTRGPAVEAVATLTDEAGTKRVLEAIRHRYGWQARLLQWFAERRSKEAEANQIGMMIQLAERGDDLG